MFSVLVKALFAFLAISTIIKKLNLHFEDVLRNENIADKIEI